MAKRNPLAEAFGIDNDELGDKPTGETVITEIPRVENQSIEQKDAEELEPGIVKLGNMTFIQKGDDLVRTNTMIAFTMKMSALEKHRLQSYAERNRLSMAEVIRDALRDIIE